MISYLKETKHLEAAAVPRELAQVSQSFSSSCTKLLSYHSAAPSDVSKEMKAPYSMRRETYGAAQKIYKRASLALVDAVELHLSMRQSALSGETRLTCEIM